MHQLSQTYTVAWPIAEGHERSVLALLSTEESLWNEDIGVVAPELLRSVQVQVREIDQHAGFEIIWFLARCESNILVDDAKGGVDSRMQSVNLHDYGIQVRHLRVKLGEVINVNRVDFGHEFREALGVLVKLNQRPNDVESDAVVTA